jgi:hypothetical protein
MALAIHEAAHYAAARALGFDPLGCTISDRGGLTRYTVRRPDTDTGRRAHVSVIFAGQLAEQMRFGETVNGHADDDRRATALLMHWPRGERPGSARSDERRRARAARAMGARRSTSRSPLHARLVGHGMKQRLRTPTRVLVPYAYVIPVDAPRLACGKFGPLVVGVMSDSAPGVLAEWVK